MLQFVSVVAVDEAGEGRGVSMHIGIDEQSTVCLLIKLSEFALLVISIAIIVYKDLCRTDRWS